MLYQVKNLLYEVLKTNFILEIKGTKFKNLILNNSNYLFSKKTHNTTY